MNDAWGTVTAVDDGQATIRMDDGGCGRCRESGGCGGNNLGQLLCATPRTLRVANPERCVVGQRVRIGVVDGSLGSSALHAYAVPLLGLFVGALGGSAVAGEIGAFGGSLGGLLAGWWGLRRAHLRSRDDPRFRPSIRP